MSVSIDWGTKIISIPKSYLTFISGVGYTLDLNQFRLDLKTLEDDEDGIMFPDTHMHNPETTLSGTTFARQFILINGYTVTFEDGQYYVEAKNANSNLADVLNYNKVSLRSFNSGGLIVSVQGSGVTAQDKVDIANEVWDKDISSATFESDTTKAGTLLNQVNIAMTAKLVVDDTVGQSKLIIYRRDGVTPLYEWVLQDKDGSDIVLQGTGPVDRAIMTWLNP